MILLAISHSEAALSSHHIKILLPNWTVTMISPDQSLCTVANKYQKNQRPKRRGLSMARRRSTEYIEWPELTKALTLAPTELSSVSAHPVAATESVSNEGQATAGTGK